MAKVINSLPLINGESKEKASNNSYFSFLLNLSASALFVPEKTT
jgi:hypothetical protein